LKLGSRPSLAFQWSDKRIRWLYQVHVIMKIFWQGPFWSADNLDLLVLVLVH
jgi:hypothetical protein